MDINKLKGIAERKLDHMRHGCFRGSLNHFIETGTINGSFLEAINSLINECEGKESSDELGNCNKPHVKARICSNCIYLYEDALAEYSGIEHRCNRLRMPVIAPDKMQCIYFGYAL